MAIKECLQCGSVNLIKKEQIFKNGTKHMALRCADCGKHNSFISEVQAKDWIMPFGKYKNQTLGQIGAKDRPYLEWLKQNNVLASSVAQGNLDKVLSETITPR